jgi:hypothetical protein
VPSIDQVLTLQAEEILALRVRVADLEGGLEAAARLEATLRQDVQREEGAREELARQVIRATARVRQLEDQAACAEEERAQLRAELRAEVGRRTAAEVAAGDAGAKLGRIRAGVAAAVAELFMSLMSQLDEELEEVADV